MHRAGRQAGSAKPKPAVFPGHRGSLGACLQSALNQQGTSVLHCQAPTPACLWDRPKSQAAARPGLLKVLPPEPAHRCTPCQHRQSLLHCAAVALPTPSKPVQARIMEQDAAPRPRAAGRKVLLQFWRNEN